jgi:hypothetical protein
MQKIIFHRFGIGDPDDPEIYAAQPLHEFMQTEKGQWVKANCADPKYIIRSDKLTWGQQVIVYGEVEDILATEYCLRWANVE